MYFRARSPGWDGTNSSHQEVAPCVEPFYIGSVAADMKGPLFAVLLFASSLVPSSSIAWGSKGHEIIVRLALQIMKPDERMAVFDLLGTDNPKTIGNWADWQRKNQPETKPWHYVNIPANVERYKESRDCQETCIISQLEWAKAIIRDHRYSKPHRREALLWWFHLVGDLYQPFHCYEKNDGGNDVILSFKGKKTNLHKLWDEDIIKSQNCSIAGIDSILLSSYEVPETIPDFVEAANLSHSRAIEAVLPKGSKVTDSYIRRWWPIILRSFWQAACMAAVMGPEI